MPQNNSTAPVQTQPTVICVDYRSLGFIRATSPELIEIVRGIDPEIAFDERGLAIVVFPHGQKRISIHLYSPKGEQIGEIQRLRAAPRPGSYNNAHQLTYRSYNWIKSLFYNTSEPFSPSTKGRAMRSGLQYWPGE